MRNTITVIISFLVVLTAISALGAQRPDAYLETAAGKSALYAIVERPEKKLDADALDPVRSVQQISSQSQFRLVANLKGLKQGNHSAAFEMSDGNRSSVPLSTNTVPFTVNHFESTVFVPSPVCTIDPAKDAPGPWRATVTIDGGTVLKAEFVVLALSAKEIEGLTLQDRSREAALEAIAVFWTAVSTNSLITAFPVSAKQTIPDTKGSNGVIRYSGNEQCAYIQLGDVVLHPSFKHLSESDLLNGIVIRAEYTVSASVFRTFYPEDGWSEWQSTSVWGERGRKIAEIKAMEADFIALDKLVRDVRKRTQDDLYLWERYARRSEHGHPPSHHLSDLQIRVIRRESGEKGLVKYRELYSWLATPTKLDTIKKALRVSLPAVEEGTEEIPNLTYTVELIDGNWFAISNSGMVINGHQTENRVAPFRPTGAVVSAIVSDERDPRKLAMKIAETHGVPVTEWEKSQMVTMRMLRRGVMR